MPLAIARDPVKLGRKLWPQYGFFDKQREMIYSVRDSVETVVVAANQVGKDFTAGYIALTFFLAPHLYFPLEYVRQIDAQPGTYWQKHTRRVVTTSVADHHLKVLWGEIGRWITSCRMPLISKDGGPLVVNHHEIRFVQESHAKHPMSYLVGQVSKEGEGMAGHHAAYTLLIGDESSGLKNEVKEQADGWAKRFLLFGNPNPCDNFFKKAVEAGNAEMA
jgi:hypothetical protein